MLQVKWFVTLLLVVCGVSALAAQNSSSNRQAAMAGAKKVAANASSQQPVMPESHRLRQVPRPAVDRHGLMAAQHPGLSYPLDQANLPASRKVHSFPELSKARFLAPTDIHPAEFPGPRPPQINRRRLLTAKPPDLPAVK